MAEQLGRPIKPQHGASVFDSLGTVLKPVTDLPPESVDVAQADAEEAPRIEASAVAAEPTTTAENRAADQGAGKRVKATPARARAQNSSPAPTADTGEKDLVNQPVNVTLKESLLTKLTAYKDRTGLSHPVILLTAIETHYDELATLIQRDAPDVEPSTPARSLFDMPRAVAHKPDGERSETFIIRVNSKNKTVLDTLWKELGAPSRNALFVAAYEAFLADK